MKLNNNFDVLVIGSGLSGLTLALSVADDANVAILSKKSLFSGSTIAAQGGIAAVLSEEDSIDNHCADTIRVGGGICSPDIVRKIVSQGSESIKWLEQQGVKFTTQKTNCGQEQQEQNLPYHLTLEGGHSYRRIVHCDDRTGGAISHNLIEKVKQHPNIEVFENCIALELIGHSMGSDSASKCTGAYVYSIQLNQVVSFNAAFVVLATGGVSRSYLYSSSLDGGCGDGIAMAWRAGCRMVNLEFQQFHPTCLYHTEPMPVLLTEALRGEGAYLRLPNGERFMKHFDEQMELASRDVVARAIDYEIKRLGIEHVYLDITHKNKQFIKSTFPSAYQNCKQFGFDLCDEQIPVVPAAHYNCGGIHVDSDSCTDLFNLYAIGEVAHTGMHGANRMASNSLLECLVTARNAADHIIKNLPYEERTSIAKLWDSTRVSNSNEEVIVTHNWDKLRRLMWDYVGIVRSNKRLLRAQTQIQWLQSEIDDYYRNYTVNYGFIELRNLAMASRLIVESAIQRKESRGLHYNIDYPEKSSIVENTIQTPNNYIPRKQFNCKEGTH